MQKYVQFTHKGWFGLCPVIIGEPHGACYMDCRWEWLNFWLDLQCSIFDVAVSIKQFFDPYYETEGWRILLTGELRRPIRRPLLDD